MKQDELSARLSAIMEFYLLHQKKVWVVGTVIVAALAIGLGAYYYVRNQQSKAGAAFAVALNTYHSPVLAAPPNIPDLESYKTDKEKNEKALAAFQKVAEEYSHYAAGRLARYYAAICQRDLGNYQEAEKEFQALSQSGDKNLAALAKMGLASVYELTNRSAEAEKIYQELEANPTETVPKSTALMARADLYKQTDPAEAATLYKQIQKENPGTPAGDYATQMLNQLPQ